jgi:cytidylate kinase
VAASVICISRALGARGDEVGALVAERLGYRYVDEEIVAQAAARGGVSPADVADEERRRSALSRLLHEIGRSVATDSYGISSMARSDAGSSEEIRGLIQAAIEETAARGNVVIVAHAASFTLPRSANVLRVLVTAPTDDRARQLSESHGLDPETATKALRESDSARADYLRRFYGVDKEQPTHYDIVVNTGSLSPERATELVLTAAG